MAQVSYYQDADYDEAIISADEEESDNHHRSFENSSLSNSSLFSYFRNICNKKKVISRERPKVNNNELYHIGEVDNSVTKDKKFSKRNINHSSSRKCVLQRSETIQQKMINLSIQILSFGFNTFLQFLKFIGKIIFMIYFILLFVGNFPCAIISKLVGFLKCYTNSSHIHNIPINLLPAIFKHLFGFVDSTFIHRGHEKMKRCGYERMNSGTIARVKRSTLQTSPQISFNQIILYFIVGLCLLVLILYSYSNSLEEICKGLSTLKNIKLKFVDNTHAIFVFPGEDCLRAGACCKGNLEGLMRWLSCLMTMPIRIVFPMLSKYRESNEHSVDGLYNIQAYFERILQEIEQIKEDINVQDETLYRIQSNFIILKMEVMEKINALENLKPKLAKPTKYIKIIKTEMDICFNLLKKVLNIRNDADKMIHEVKIDSENSESIIYQALSQMRASIEIQHQTLEAQISLLENLLIEDKAKSNKRNQRMLIEIQNEIDSILHVHNEIQKRITPLSLLQVRFKEARDNFYKDFLHKLNEEMLHHEQMSKKIEYTCSNSLDGLQNNFKKEKEIELECFINQTIKEYAAHLYKELRTDISSILDEKTIDISNTILGQALTNQTNNQIIRPSKNIKVQMNFGYFPNIFKLNGNKVECLQNGILVNTTLFCDDTNLEMWSVGTSTMKDTIDNIIHYSLEQLRADTIGMADFALETSGGSVLSDKSTPSYTGKATFISLFGITIGQVIKSIRKIIQPQNLPGECWAFAGHTGHVVIRLAKRIAITAVSIDHVSHLLTPNGKIKSAPNVFHIYIFKDLQNSTEIKLEEFAYSQDGDPIQTFYLKEISPVTQFIKFKFLSNHGNEDYTCIYRLRVHGNYFSE